MQPKKSINHCQLGKYHMLEKIAYDYVIELSKAANKELVKSKMAESSKKYSDEEKNKLREFIQKWLTR